MSERVHVPAFGGATEWLNTEPLGRPELHVIHLVPSRVRSHGVDLAEPGISSQEVDMSIRQTQQGGATDVVEQPTGWRGRGGGWRSAGAPAWSTRRSRCSRPPPTAAIVAGGVHATAEPVRTLDATMMTASSSRARRRPANRTTTAPAPWTPARP